MKIYRDFQKVKAVIESCETLGQLLTAMRMETLFTNKYPRYDHPTNYTLADELDRYVSSKDYELRKRLK